MDAADKTDIAVEIISERIGSLEPAINSQIAVAHQAVAELLRLLEERGTLEGTIQSLTRGHFDPPVDSRGTLRGRDPVSRAQRAKREIEMLEREPMIDSGAQGRTGRLSGLSPPEVTSRVGRMGIIEIASKFAERHSGQVHMRELAQHVVDLDPDRYRSVATAQASLYYHLGKSEKFEKIGAGVFRRLADEASVDSSGTGVPIEP